MSGAAPATEGAPTASAPAPFTLIPLGDASAAACDGDSCALPA
ncbi:hypothetical protein N136_04627 [Leifsonia aquatica ATCC 14665]|uniref:Uncharacterized protein n=1 Tax=Leifsonia aquatica ATCC 14665 TaxID=1358026 RepID=U2QXI2_LEIAQ|nr:hypothetical protein N136_04627 [Leifsonia aquatica ATCC 14665]